METLIAAVGRSRKGPEQALFEQYAARLRPTPRICEVEEKRPLPVAERMEREAMLLLQTIPEGAKIIALDEQGEMLGSRAFAGLMGKWRDEGVPATAFLIGGADGHGEEVRSRAHRLLAFGPMTWPHFLVRGLLAEQLYRVQCILGGHPYHRD